jgi:hypothetical protein
MTSGFPGVGHRYFVDFVAFQVELDFASETSLTNITESDLSFDQFHGTFRQLS